MDKEEITSLFLLVFGLIAICAPCIAFIVELGKEFYK